jgi:hypothetical protein
MGGCEGGLPKSPYGGDLKDNKYTALRFGGGLTRKGEKDEHKSIHRSHSPRRKYL